MTDERGARVFAVVNATAGGGRAGRCLPGVLAAWRAGGAEVEVAETTGPEHATALARRAATAGWPVVAAVGGDGTVHEVVAGLLDADAGHDAALTIIPCGSGNDLVKALGTPADPVAAAGALSGAERVTIDVGRVRFDGSKPRTFVNGLGVGLDARIVRRAANIPVLRGVALYGMALLAELARPVPTALRIEVDGAPPQTVHATMVTVSNGTTHGGGFRLLPEARLDDGMLDLLVADAMDRRGIARFLTRSLKGAHGGMAGVRWHRVRSVRVEGDGPLAVHVDGEIVEGARTLYADLMPDALTVMRQPGARPARENGHAGRVDLGCES